MNETTEDEEPQKTDEEIIRDTAVEIAAGSWCDPRVANRAMDSELCSVFIDQLTPVVRRVKALENALEWTLGALANQKFVNEAPPCGDAMAMEPGDYRATQKGIQSSIDWIYHRGWDVLLAGRKKSS